MGDLTAHFSKSEFACHCGCGFGANDGDVSPVLLDSLETLRANLGKPITIDCGCRCAEHNRAVGGAEHSQHIDGIAADIRVPGLSPIELSELAQEIPAFKNGGIGLAKWGCHLDVRGTTARWAYDPNTNRTIGLQDGLTRFKDEYSAVA